MPVLSRSPVAVQVVPEDMTYWETAHDFRKFEAEVSTAGFFLRDLSKLLNLLCLAERGLDAPEFGRLAEKDNRGQYRARAEVLERLSNGSQLMPESTWLQYETVVELIFDVSNVSFQSPLEFEFGAKIRIKTKEISAILAMVSAMGLFTGLTPPNGNTTVTPGKQQWEQFEPIYRTQIDTEGVRAVQAILRQLGFDPGRIDGRPGKHTQIAIDKFAVKHGLPQGLRWDDRDLGDALAREMALKGF
jgi:hypothetical protein